MSPSLSFIHRKHQTVVHRVNDIDFVWDQAKAKTNLLRRGVSLETACEIFFDPFVRLIRTEHIGGEDRELAAGMTKGWELLVVVYTFRGDSIRLISARPASNAERNAYEEK